MNTTTMRLGRSIAQIVPFYRQRQEEQQPQQRKEIITNKLVITMVIVAIAKIAVFLLWPI